MSTSSNPGPPACGRDRDWLSDHDRSIIGQAYQLVGVPGPAVRACFGNIAVSYGDTAHAYAEALSQATKVIAELLAIIERLADGGAGVTVPSERDEPSDRSQPESVGQAELIRARPAIVPARVAGRERRPGPSREDDALPDSEESETRRLSLRVRNLGVDRFTVWAPGEAGSVLDTVHDEGARCVVIDLGSLPTREEQSSIAAVTFHQGEALIAGKISPQPALLRFGARISEEGGADGPATWAHAR